LPAKIANLPGTATGIEEDTPLLAAANPVFVRASRPAKRTVDRQGSRKDAETQSQDRFWLEKSGAMHLSVAGPRGCRLQRRKSGP